MELKILTLEDNPGHQKLIAIFLEQLAVKSFDIARNSKEFFSIIEERGSDFNLLIIDIHLDEDSMNGLDCYKLYRKAGGKMPAIIVTMDPIHLDRTELQKIDVIDVVDKANLYCEGGPLPAAFDKACKHLQYQQFDKEGCLYVPVAGESLFMLPVEKVLYIQSKLREITVHTDLGSFRSDISLKQYSSYLDTHGFLSVSRSSLVNLERVDEFHKYDQTLTFQGDHLRNHVKVADDRVGTVRRILNR
ncbi:LytTR family DNA-binding domain-containing protein [Brevibacillus sp. DP1.3A]|uniref:LytR/AlgR family response regulator transcription factor n=1 Tax=Brevibacillus sp. DP1.3A TaxID=2738867 RepID=UPI00156AC823|nr:LytTR family transcriptional regulator DNA-binding domain-containing protein [Brevibacillus sp. DP1.3A]UED78078.1 LytTR family transcriptional regulator DNA-binding domain-containing protein [Brevibacillus sp. DP1.3A]